MTATTARTRATLRLLLDSGDITMQGVRLMEAVCAAEERNTE